MEQDNETNGKRRRGIYLLPNLFTTAALFAGFYAIVSGMGGEFEYAAVAIFVAMVLDGLDGRVARLTNTQSDFGAEYDSLADMVSFGLAPALVVRMVSLGHGEIGLACGIRLCRCRGAAPGPLQYPGGRRRQALLPGIGQPGGGSRCGGSGMGWELIRVHRPAADDADVLPDRLRGSPHGQ